MSLFRFVLLIASAWGLLVSVSAHNSTPALYEVTDNVFRFEKGTLKQSDDGSMKLYIIGALSYVDDMNNQHIVEYWRDGKKFDQYEVKEFSEELNDILKKYHL